MDELVKAYSELELAEKHINELAAKRDAEKDEAKKAGLVSLLNDAVKEFEARSAHFAELEERDKRKKEMEAKKARMHKPEGKSVQLTDPQGDGEVQEVNSEHNVEAGKRAQDELARQYLTGPEKPRDYLARIAAKRGENLIQACHVNECKGLRAPRWMRDFILPQPTADAAVRHAFPHLAGKDALEAYLEGKGTNDVLVRDASGTNSGGGSLVMSDFVNQTYKIPQNLSDVPNRCWVKRGVGKSALFPKLTQSSTERFGVTATWGNAGAVNGEGTSLTESDPVHTQVEVTTERLGLFTYISDKALRAQDVGLEAELAWMYKGAWNDQVSKAILHGPPSGLTNPRGINTNTSIAAGVVVVAREGAGAITYVDLAKLAYSVEDGVLDDGIFILRSGSSGALVHIVSKDDSDGRPIFVPETAGWAGPRPAMIAGFPYVRSMNGPTLGYRGDALFGSFMSYGLVVDVDNLAIERSDDYAFTSGLVTYRLQTYLGGIPLGYSCFAVLGDASGASSSSSSSSS